MSIVIAVKARDGVVLATDSRGVAPTFDGTWITTSDACQKLFDLSNGMFYAYSGFEDFGNSHARVAVELAVWGGPTDIRAFADKLDADSHALMTSSVQGNIGRSHMQTHPLTHSFHVYFLAGLVGGRPTYLVREFYLSDTFAIRSETTVAPVESTYHLHSTRREYISEWLADPRIWATGATAGIEYLITKLKRVVPEVGGPVQMVCIDVSGGRWIHPPLFPCARAKAEVR